MKKKNRQKIVKLASLINHLMSEREINRIQSDAVADAFISTGFSDSQTNAILRLWEDSITLYKQEFNLEAQIKTLCDILEKLPDIK